jgi:hypothetical protein
MGIMSQGSGLYGLAGGVGEAGKMAVTYLNWRGPQGRETVDQLDSKDFPDWKAVRTELRRLIGEYSLCGMAVYPSTRMCGNWKD